MMTFTIDPASVTHGIQLALAPVFLLTAVAGMISAVAGRLARIIDRARLLEERVLAVSADLVFRARAMDELALLRRRGHLANGCMSLLTCCAFLIGLTIIFLFLGQTTAFAGSVWAVAGFLLGVACFLAALMCFLAETMLATRLLNFQLPAQQLNAD